MNKLFGLLDQNNVLVGYSQFPVASYVHESLKKDGTREKLIIKCEPNVEYDSDNVGKKFVGGKFYSLDEVG
jgi:hypothetical protein